MLLLCGCLQAPQNDYQQLLSDNPQRALFILNGNAESISIFDPASSKMYSNVQTVGHSGTNRAVPNDIIDIGGKLRVVLSGQNSIETYDKLSLDYEEGGKHYFKNGYNPMNFIPVDGSSWCFVPGLEKDQIQAVNLNKADADYSFADLFESVTLGTDAHSESRTAPTAKNALGDNHRRGSTSGAVLKNGAASRVYVGNVRVGDILLTDSSGRLEVYPAGSGTNLKAPGSFREGTLSILSFNSDSLTDGVSGAGPALSLVKEINLESLIPGRTYLPGDGLNPQSVFILDGRLNIVCTGTNGGSVRRFADGEYIPWVYRNAGLTTGSVKPGTDPDDGIILVLDISNPDQPAYLTHLAIGGSPAGFRSAVDTVRKIVYLAGVGGVQSYRYGSTAADYSVLHSSADMILTAAKPELDYYSGLYYDSVDSRLYVSFYTGDMLKSISVGGSAASPAYSSGDSWQTGDGPGALVMIQRR